MTTFNTIEDFLRIVRENDEVRSAVRRELMTAEVLALPAQFATMLNTQKSLLEEQRNMRREMTSMLETQNSLLEEQRNLRRDTNSLLEEQRNQRREMTSMLETQNSLLEEQKNLRRDTTSLLEEQRNQRREMTSMLETQNSLLEEQKNLRRDTNALLEEQKNLRRDTNALLEEQKNLRRDTNALLEEQKNLRRDTNALLAEQMNMRRDIGALHGMYRRQHDDLARFRGNYALDAARENYVAIARLFARRNGLRRMYVRPLADVERRGILARNTNALESLDLQDATWDTFMSPDLVAEVTDLNNGEEPRYYIAVEASFTADRKDLQRATDHAKILRCATGQEAYAVVAAVKLTPNIEDLVLEDAAEYLEADNEETALWFTLVEEELEPPDPC